MKRRIPAAILIVSILAITGCDVSSDSKAGSKSDKPTQLPMVTAANEMAAKARLLSIATAEAAFQIDNGSFATLDELLAKGFLNNPSDGKLARYRFDVRPKTNGFEATAVPEKYGISGNQSFYIDESRVIRGGDKGGAKASSSDPPL